jgi:hypothetical protein
VVSLLSVKKYMVFFRFWKLIIDGFWWNKVPMRTTFFAWLDALGKIFTMDNPRKRHVIVVDWCCMCKRRGKPVDHLFSTVRLLLFYEVLFFCHVGLTWVLPRRVVDIFSCGRGLSGSPQCAVLWKMVVMSFVVPLEGKK